MKSKKISDFYKVVGKRTHVAMAALERAKEKDQRDAKIAKRTHEDQLKLVELAELATRKEIFDLDPPTTISSEIDEKSLDLEDATVVVETTEKKKKRRAWSTRPSNWPTILENYLNFGLRSTIKAFPDIFADQSENYSAVQLSRWKKEMRSGKLPGKELHHSPPYGKELDLDLLKAVKERLAIGLAVDSIVLRVLLLPMLVERSLSHLLVEKGGEFLFGYSWANRFFKRYNLSSRAVTTKMRDEIPADFEAKREVYLNIGSVILTENSIPPSLVIGLDETNALFVPRATRNRAEKGARKVPSQGVGKEKPQVTTTIAANESGELLSYQVIFGGKTKRSLPKGLAPPPGAFFDFTPSHWQTPESYCRFINHVLIPYRLEKIAESGLPSTQKMLLKHDLHYSHKDPKVLKLLEENHIIPLFVPAGCTDVLQECDTVINKPFKSAMKAAFRDYLHSSYQEHRKDPTIDPANGNQPLGLER
jgi:hypothetical protein